MGEQNKSYRLYNDRTYADVREYLKQSAQALTNVERQRSVLPFCIETLFCFQYKLQTIRDCTMESEGTTEVQQYVGQKEQTSEKANLFSYKEISIRQ